MGDRLYEPEEDYTGLGALVPGDENTLYISTNFDPRDPSGDTQTVKHEIYKGVLVSNVWNWTAITENSSVDNLRPIVPDNHGVGPRTVFWFRGNYTSAHDINAAVVGIVERDNETLGLIHYVDANSVNTTYASGSPLATSAPSDSAGPDDDLWHQRTGFGNGGSVLSSNESGAENAPLLRTTVTGLSAGQYDVFAYFWSDNDEDWRLQAGLEQGNLIDFRKYGSQHAEADQFLSIEAVSASGNDLLLYRAYLGRVDLAQSGGFDVFVDDWQTLNGSASRTWYDGVGYAQVVGVLKGDFDGDGDVDGADFLVWQRNPTIGDLSDWNVNYGSQLHISTSTAVPEPDTALLALGIAGAVILSRRQGTQPRHQCRKYAKECCNRVVSLTSTVPWSNHRCRVTI